MPSAERLALNEEIFRAVNDQIAALSSTHAAADAPGFVCECARMECTAQVSLSLAEYAEIRARDRQYVVLRGHELDPVVERVVAAGEGFLVVEKVHAPMRIDRSDDT